MFILWFGKLTKKIFFFSETLSIQKTFLLILLKSLIKTRHFNSTIKKRNFYLLFEQTSEYHFRQMPYNKIFMWIFLEQRKENLIFKETKLGKQRRDWLEKGNCGEENLNSFEVNLVLDEGGSCVVYFKGNSSFFS